MAPPPKKKKSNEVLPVICIRLCDSYKRTPQKLISPFIRAEDSVRVVYKLQQELLKNIVVDAGNEVGLQLLKIAWCPLPEDNDTLNGNIFIEYASTVLWDEDSFTKYKNSVQSKLQNVNIKNILVHQVKDQLTLPQPAITDIDLKIFELDLKFQNYFSPYQHSEETNIISADLENILSLIKELKEKRIQIAILSHNAIGKSFILNLLLLLTAEDGCSTGKGRRLKLAKDIAGTPTVKMVKEEEFDDLPEAIKDFLDEITNDEQDFKNLMQPICHNLILTHPEKLGRVEESFHAMSAYYTNKIAMDIEPYLLPQKDSSADYNATTQCIFHLRYGSSFQAKVKYFDEKQLQDQLFELVTLEQGSEKTKPDLINEKIKEKAYQSLKTKFRNLTDNVSTDEETLLSILKSVTCPEEITLCEEVKKFAGKTELYIGDGKNPAQDRLALQKLLKGYTSSDLDDFDDDDDDDDHDKVFRSIKAQKIASLESLVVYVPSSLLYGGLEILEMPGTNDSDPLSFSFIQDALDTADAVILLSEFGFRLAGQEVVDCLTNSRFIRNWTRNTDKYKLMFASYPEKNVAYQFGANDHAKLQRVIPEEDKKRKEELHRFEELLHPVPLTPEMKENIFSKTLLPVLHSSIHALQGDPLDIFEKNKDFLKNTGVDLFIAELMKIMTQRKQTIIKEIEMKFQDFEAYQKDETNDQQKDDAPPAFKNIDITQETDFLKKNEDLFNRLKEQHEEIIKEAVEKTLKNILVNVTSNAVKKWNEIKGDVSDAKFFNPQYGGKHPEFKIKMSDLLFGHLEEEVFPFLKDLTESLHIVLQDYKQKAIRLFTEELRIKNIKLSTVTRSLECALACFLGKTRTSFNEDTLMKSFETIFRDCMKKHILAPAYRDHIKNTRHNMETYIRTFQDKLQESFLQTTFSLYNERWPANLARFMVRSCMPINSSPNTQPGCTFCGRIRCSLCVYMGTTTTFSSSTKNKVYTIPGCFTCNTKNVIYLMTCKKCKMQYVGQTTQIMRKRFIDHLSKIKCKNNTPVAQHFSCSDHSVQDITLVVIEQVTNGSHFEREKYWIEELGTLKPAGLNAKV